MKYLKVVLVIILLFSIVVSTTGCRLFDFITADKIEVIFYENEDMFVEAAKVLHNILKDRDLRIWILTENDDNDSPGARKIDNIYFEPGDSFTDEEYKAMYDCVESLFSLKIIDGIFGCDSYIRFAIPNRWDDDASLYYTKEGTNFPNIVGQIEEHEYIAPNWHAVVVSTFD